MGYLDAINDLYSMIFDLEYLVRYGYYDVAIKERKAITTKKIKNIYGNTDVFYFKIFNMEKLVECIKDKEFIEFFKPKLDEINFIATEPVYFSIPKNKISRRLYKMPNIYSYLALSFFVCKYKEKFIDIFKANKNSTSKFFNSLVFRYEITDKIRMRSLFIGNQRLYLDLANFYPTLYTHSIPWMILGKEKAKKNRRNGFANELDKMIMKCQYDETHGIPTGNLITKIIAELYMCYFDMKLGEKYLYSRYVDDIIYPFYGNYDSFITKVRSVCREYNLNLNEQKTKVEEFPYSLVNEKNDIFSFLKDIKNNSNVKECIRTFDKFIDYCVHSEANGNKGAIKCIYSVLINHLRREKFKKEVINYIFNRRDALTGFNLFEKLIDISFKNPILCNRFLSFTEDLINMGVYSENVNKIMKIYVYNNKSAINKILSYYIKNEMHQEIYQVLIYLVQFNVPIRLKENKFLDLITPELDDYSLILVTILYLKNISTTKNELFTKLEGFFSDSHNNYGDNSYRMAEKFWLFRYFIYSLINQGIISQKELKNYWKEQSFEKSNNCGYKSELNWKYIRRQTGGNSNINDFYNYLIEKNIWLVYCGENNDFVY